MAFWILLVAQMVTGIVAGEGPIGKYPEGRKALDKLAGAGLFFLKWRAYADYKVELRYLRRIFGWGAVVFAALLLTLGPTESPSLFNAIPGFFIMLWVMMQFGTDFKKSVGEQLSIVGLLAIGPWAILLVDSLSGYQVSQLRILATPFNGFGLQELTNYQLAFTLSIIGALGGLIFAVVSIVLFSIVPLFFLFLIVLLSKISSLALRTNARTAYHIAIFYFFVVGPILIALEGKGLI